jgi:methylamine dehydrogenase accessory protein MauD
MHGFWLISYILLWGLAVMLSVIALSLMRMIGQMNERLGPAPALVNDQGLEIGDLLPHFMADSGIAEQGVLSFPKRQDSLLIFVSPGCVTCDRLLRSVPAFRVTRYRDVEVIVASTSGNEEHNRDLKEKASSDQLTFLPLPKLAKAMDIRATPYAFWLDAEGVVVAKGLVNNMEHLESLRNARIAGVSSLEEHHETVHVAGQAKSA